MDLRMTCTDCGHEWTPDAASGQHVCPNCGGDSCTAAWIESE